MKETICDNEHDKRHYKEAVTAITVDEPLHRFVPFGHAYSEVVVFIVVS